MSTTTIRISQIGHFVSVRTLNLSAERSPWYANKIYHTTYFIAYLYDVILPCF